MTESDQNMENAGEGPQEVETPEGGKDIELPATDPDMADVPPAGADVEDAPPLDAEAAAAPPVDTDVEDAPPAVYTPVDVVPPAPEAPRPSRLTFPFAPPRLAPIALAAALLFLALSGVVLSHPVQLYGDGMAYLGMAASIVKDRDLKFDEGDLLFTARWGDPETFLPFTEKGIHTRPDRNGALAWGTHSFYYPLLVAPFLMLFGVKGAVFLNVLLFVGVFALLAHTLARVSPAPRAGLCAALALLLCTPLLSYVFWVHTEISLFFAVTAALLALLAGRPVPGALLLGWASAQKPPLVLVFGLFVLWIMIRDRHYRNLLRAGLAMGAILAPQLLYNLTTFGSLSSFGNYVDPALVSGERLFTFWLGPARGMVWFFPLLCWCLLRASTPWWWTLACAATALAVSAGSCVITVFYGHEIGIRYAVYLYPLFLAMLPAWKFSRLDFVALGAALFLAGGLFLNPLGNLALWQVYPNPYPSRLLADAGVPMYPETIQRTDMRLAREVTADYLDSDMRTRREQLRLTAMRPRDPEVVVKLYAEPAGHLPEGASASLQIAGEAPVSQPLAFNRITTLHATTAPERLGRTTLPNVKSLDPDGGSSIAIMRMLLDAPLFVSGIGSGTLRWSELSRPDDPQFDGYVYRRGPYFVGVYPGRSWFVETMASDDLAAAGLVQNRFNAFAPAGEIGSVAVIEGGSVEGTTSVCLTVPPREGQVPLVFVTESVPLALGPGFEKKLEILGWYRSTGLESWGISALFEGVPTDKREVPVGVGVASAEWRLFRREIDVPDGATGVALSVAANGEAGTLYLDDVIVAKWWDPWN